jgi:hypothetical protein
MGIKVWCYWEHFGEPIGNFVKFTWEPYEKRLGTFIWDRKEPPKNISCWAGQSHQKLNVVVVHIYVQRLSLHLQQNFLLGTTT